jgi:hypothetical protein
MSRKLYIDTSVIGGYHDSEWMTDTRLHLVNVRREDGFNAVNIHDRTHHPRRPHATAGMS